VNAIRDDDDDQILPLSACYVKEFKNEIKVLLSIHLEKKFSFKKKRKRRVTKVTHTFRCILHLLSRHTKTFFLSNVFFSFIVVVTFA